MVGVSQTDLVVYGLFALGIVGAISIVVVVGLGVCALVDVLSRPFRRHR